MKEFIGKAALVTGAAGGIGGAVVRMLRSHGVRVAVADRNTEGLEAGASSRKSARSNLHQRTSRCGTGTFGSTGSKISASISPHLFCS